MKTKQLILFFLSLALAGLFFGCGNDPETDLPTDSTKALVGNSYYIVNPATTYQSVPELDGITMKAAVSGSAGAIAGFVIKKNDTSSFAASVSNYVTTDEIRAIITLLGEQNYTNKDFSTINEQVYTKYTEFTVGDYSFSTATATTTIALSNKMMNTLASATEILPVGSAITATEFRMFVTVTNFNQELYYTVSISPKEDSIFQKNFALMTALSSGTNYTSIIERLVQDTNNFSGLSDSSNQADFLFMVDDSGSMGSKQAALTAAGNDFKDAISLAGLNFNIAILTTSAGADGIPCTDGCYDRILQDVGIIDNNISLFNDQINLIGTSGSPVETGIYNSEQALKDGGLLKTAPFSFPRENTQLSIVILSDEVSQYDSRAGTSFNPKKNIFVDNNILVNSIVDTGLCGDSSFYIDGGDTNGQYDDLSIATGGLVGNICNGGDNPNYSAVMQNIAFQATGAYKLDYNNAKPNSLNVSVNGVSFHPSIIDGYMYIEGTNSIAFFGTLPSENDDIEVYYEYPKDIDLFAND
ncbi:MAG: hypothetical protein L3I99_07835 [Sulfurimonas sp.]|nr:hypothetical protein [Sulfurimonas sp.]